MAKTTTTMTATPIHQQASPTRTYCRKELGLDSTLRPERVTCIDCLTRRRDSMVAAAAVARDSLQDAERIYQERQNAALDARDALEAAQRLDALREAQEVDTMLNSASATSCSWSLELPESPR